MSAYQKYSSCANELGAEYLMYFGVGFATLLLAIPMKFLDTSLFLSTIYSLFLPLMSYMFSEAKQYNNPEGEGRAQIILIWMVLVEINRIGNVPFTSWGLGKSAEQLVRLVWIGFLICTFTPIQGIRVNLLALCSYYFVYEVLKGIVFYKGKKSYLMGKNPKLIHNYVKRIMLQDGLRTTPMNSCDYIVMGEQNHEIDDSINGYSLGKKKSNSVGMLTIGRVLQLNLPKADTCISLALAKMLMGRFAKLPLDEAGCKKSLDFVLNGLIGDIGGYQDTQTDRNDGERSKMKRVFCIIEKELKLVREFLRVTVPTYYYFPWYAAIVFFSNVLVIADGIYLIFATRKKSFAWASHRGVEAYNHCFFHFVKTASHSVLVTNIAYFDAVIIILLVFILIFPVLHPLAVHNFPVLFNLYSVKRYLKNPANWNRSYSSETPAENELPKTKGENTHWAILRFSRSGVLELSTPYHPKWLALKFIRLFQGVTVKTDAKEAILRVLRKSGGELTNGEASLKKYSMEHLNWACQLNGSNTEAILVWHIATTLFHHLEPSIEQNNDPNQEPAPQQNNNPFTKEVALSLSSYCHYLVSDLPELLPDDVKWTKKMYGNLVKDILSIPRSSDRCKYALDATWHESSVVRNGVKLAKELMNCAKEGTEVWTMLAHFWAEMMLFIAPSDNVEGHAKILIHNELITQLWALLTHAGIITRPKPTEHQADESESNEITEADNV